MCATIYSRYNKHLLLFFYSRFTESGCITYKLALPEVSNEFLPIVATSFASIYDQSNAQGKHYLRHEERNIVNNYKIVFEM